MSSPKGKKQLSKLEQIAKINAECFTSDDSYSSLEYLEYLKEKGAKFITCYDKDKLVGYIIYQELDTHIESLRRALTKEARGKGFGVALTKRLIAVAKKTNKEIYTYVSKTNLPSLNSNFKCGYRVTDIGEHWVYIKYKP